MSLLGLLSAAAGEGGLRSALGLWRQAVSLAVDQLNQLEVAQDFVTQSTWFVDAANGSDSNSGESESSALRTLAELTRRWNGRTFSSALSSVTVTLLGDFSAEYLTLSATFTGNTAVTIQGRMTTVYAGAITTFTAYNAGTSTRSTMTDAGVADWTTHVGRRLRVTSGAVNGAITRVLSVGGAVTIANIGQWYRSSGSSTNPGLGVSYVIETFDSRVKGFDLRLVGDGGASLLIRDIAWDSAQASPAARSFCSSFAETTALNTIFGCDFVGNSAIVPHQLAGVMQLISCAHSIGPLNLTDGVYTQLGHCAFAITQLFDNCAVVGSNSVHEGAGVRDVALALVRNQASIQDLGQRGFFSSINGTYDACVVVDEANTYSAPVAAAILWGVTNTCSYGIRIRSLCHVLYATKPTVTGGVNDTIVGGTATAYAAVPFINTTNNAAIVVRA